MIKYPELPKPPNKICFRCDEGKGNKMVKIYSYKVSGDVDKLLCYICPNCEAQVDPGKKAKGIMTC